MKETKKKRITVLNSHRQTLPHHHKFASRYQVTKADYFLSRRTLIVSYFSSGLFSTIMRDLASINNDSPKWIVLDGDIDPMWIESLNTVMDDNKVIFENEKVVRTSKLLRELVECFRCFLEVFIRSQFFNT